MSPCVGKYRKGKKKGPDREGRLWVGSIWRWVKRGVPIDIFLFVKKNDVLKNSGSPRT